MYILGKTSKNEVLGMADVPTLTPSSTPISTPSTPIPTPIKTLSPTKSPSPTPTPKPTPVSTLTSSSEVNAFIDRFSAQYSVDANVLRYIAICESGFKSNASKAGYVGLYQFGPVTWKNIRKEIGEDPNPELRYSAEESIQTAAYALSKGKGGIWPNCQP